MDHFGLWTVMFIVYFLFIQFTTSIPLIWAAKLRSHSVICTYSHLLSYSSKWIDIRMLILSATADCWFLSLLISITTIWESLDHRKQQQQQPPAQPLNRFGPEFSAIRRNSPNCVLKWSLTKHPTNSKVIETPWNNPRKTSQYSKEL